MTCVLLFSIIRNITNKLQATLGKKYINIDLSWSIIVEFVFCKRIWKNKNKIIQNPSQNNQFYQNSIYSEFNLLCANISLLIESST